LYGVVGGHEDPVTRRSGARIDPLGQAFHVTPDEFERLLDRQSEHMSPKSVKERRKDIAAKRQKKDATLSASTLGLGGVPPGTTEAFGVSVPEIRRTRTYSLAALRRLRFGGSEDEDVRARSALLAILLLGAAYADADPEIRAYCDVAAPRGEARLDAQPIELDLSIDACSAFLAGAIDELPARLAWRGQVQGVEGDPALDRGATSDIDDEE
jgi:CRISPR-associated protein Csb1